MDNENEKEKNGLTPDDRIFLKSLEKLYTGWAFFVESVAPGATTSLLQPSILVGYLNQTLITAPGGNGVQMGTYVKMFSPLVTTTQIGSLPVTYESLNENEEGWWLPFIYWMPLYMATRSTAWLNSLNFGAGAFEVKAVFAYRPENN